MRTLIVSDLHLGIRSHNDVLRAQAPQAALLDALGDVDRLVLLGDIVELLPRQLRGSLTVAEPILRRLGERLGPEREVVIVPGNHDAAMVRPWALAQGARLGTAQAVDPGATGPLRSVCSWLAPARVRVSYPGVWLGDRVWATHGHYLDHHLVPESAFGLPRRRPLKPDLALPIDYERGRARRVARNRRARARAHESFFARLRSRPVATALETLAWIARMRAIPEVPHLMMRAHLASLTARAIDAQMRHAAVPAMVDVARRLAVEADWIVFGHVHRLGPTDGSTWQPRDGGPRVVNTGSWLYEPLLVDRVSPPHPYWPGGAVLLESGSPPRALGLLDHLSAADVLPATTVTSPAQRASTGSAHGSAASYSANVSPASPAPYSRPPEA